MKTPSTSLSPNMTTSRSMVWTGRIIGYVPALMMLAGTLMTLANPQSAVEGMRQLDFPESVIVPLSSVVAICLLLYLFPPTAVLGAILLTGYLGGAVASHVRLEEGAFKSLLPVVFASLLWGGLYLRDRRIRQLIPWRQ